jgi:hypothetical protein
MTTFTKLQANSCKHLCLKFSEFVWKTYKKNTIDLTIQECQTDRFSPRAQALSLIMEDDSLFSAFFFVATAAAKVNFQVAAAKQAKRVKHGNANRPSPGLCGSKRCR